MAYVYVGTAGQLDAVRTGALLTSHPVHAIWCPPPNLIAWNVPVTPTGGEPLLLAWRDGNAGALVPIAFGRIAVSPQPHYGEPCLWTNPARPEMNPFAQAMGYGGGPAASYLRLQHVQMVPQPAVAVLAAALPPMHNGLNWIADPAPWHAGAALPCGC